MQTYTSMSYREIAVRYNELNAIPTAAAAQLGAAIAQLVGTATPVLDFGAGAGRIAIPALRAGVPIIPLDYEIEMLRVSRQLKGGGATPHVQGDVVHLPYADDSFGTVFTSNVLHLVAEWETALREAVRVLQPAGSLIFGRDVLDPDANAAKLRTQLRQIVGHLDPSMRPTAAAGPGLFQALGRLGGRPGRPVIAARWTETLSINDLLDRMATRQRNDTWALNDATLQPAMVQLQEWAAASFADLQQPETIQWEFQLMPIMGLK